MAATEVNRSCNEQRQLERGTKPPEATYHKFMLVLTYYTSLRLTLWGEQFDH